MSLSECRSPGRSGSSSTLSIGESVSALALFKMRSWRESSVFWWYAMAGPVPSASDAPCAPLAHPSRLPNDRTGVWGGDGDRMRPTASLSGIPLPAGERGYRFRDLLLREVVDDHSEAARPADVLGWSDRSQAYRPPSDRRLPDGSGRERSPTCVTRPGLPQRGDRESRLGDTTDRWRQVFDEPPEGCREGGYPPAKRMAVRGVPLFQKWLLIPICTDCSIR